MERRNEKATAGKPRWSLLPRGFVAGVVSAFEHGLRKYERDGWQRVADAHRVYYDAAQRHLDTYWRGQRIDAESGVHHLLCAAASLAIMWWHDERDEREDQRWRKGGTQE